MIPPVLSLVTSDPTRTTPLETPSRAPTPAEQKLLAPLLEEWGKKLGGSLSLLGVRWNSDAVGDTSKDEGSEKWAYEKPDVFLLVRRSDGSAPMRLNAKMVRATPGESCLGRTGPKLWWMSFAFASDGRLVDSLTTQTDFDPKGLSFLLAFRPGLYDLYREISRSDAEECAVRAPANHRAAVLAAEAGESETAPGDVTAPANRGLVLAAGLGDDVWAGASSAALELGGYARAAYTPDGLSSVGLQVGVLRSTRDPGGSRPDRRTTVTRAEGVVDVPMKTRRDLTTQRQSLAVALRLRLGADVEKLNGTSVSMLGGADLVTHTTTFGPSDRLQVALVSGLSFEVPILGETSTGCFGFRLGLEVSLNPPMKPAAKVDPER